MKVNTLYEILVPTVSNEGKPYRTRYHKVWDSKVKSITGGLTVLKPVKGYWSYEGEDYIERMIPVRILCSKDDIVEIMDMTLDYYDQKAVFAYKVSSEAMIRFREP